LGFLATDQGDLTRAKECGEEALAIFREVEDVQGIAVVLTLLGDTDLYEGKLTEAEARYQESLALSRELGLKYQIASCLSGLALVARKQGKLDLAWERSRQSLELARELGQPHLILWLVGDTAALALDGGEAVRAACRRGAEAALREQLSIPLPPVEWAEGEKALAQIRAMLSEAEFSHAWEAGRAMTLQEAVSYALAEDSAQ
jgi:ATP/maltotriose-dependent transcriptional regulator MalT